MIKSLFKMVSLLFRNISFYIILIISFILSIYISNNEWSIEGLKLVPSIIGVLFGGLLTTIAIIFSIIKDEELKGLYKKYGDSFFDSLQQLKYHILLILLTLILSIFAFLLDIPDLLLKILNMIPVSVNIVFPFLQVFFFLLTIYSTIEVVNILFLIFEIKFEILKKR